MGSKTTHGERIELAVQRLNHSATLSVQPFTTFETWIIIPFSFLFSFDSISNPLVDALFWSQIDYRLFFSISIVYFETDEEIFDKKLDK